MGDLKRLEDMSYSELFNLVVDLIIDGAEVQGVDNEVFAEDFGVDWSEED